MCCHTEIFKTVYRVVGQEVLRHEATWMKYADNANVGISND